MSVTACPKCATQLSQEIDTCPNCGAIVHAPIRRLSGQLQAVGTILIAASVIAMVLGTWWGAALLFPGVIVFFFGRML